MKSKTGIIIFCLIFFCGCKTNFLSHEGVFSEVQQATGDVNITAITPTSHFYQVAGRDNPEMYEILFGLGHNVGDIGAIKGAIVPHHLVGGYLPATLFSYLKKQNPSLIVIFGPNHFNKGGAKVITSASDWQTPFGMLSAEKAISMGLAEKGVAKIDEEVFAGEHSISTLIPFVAEMLPKTKILPIIFPYNTDFAALDKLIAALTPMLPADAVIISSIDFSHYQNPVVADFHDELNRAVVRNFEYARIQNMEIDSPASLYTLLKIMEASGSQKIGFELSDNSWRLMDNPTLEETTSYYSPYFVTGEKEEDRLSSMLFFGDMMLDRSVKKRIDASGTDYILEELAGEEDRFFMGSDIVHANLEGPFADSRRTTSKAIAFRFDPLLIPMLKKYRFNILSQANNHSLDMGNAGYEESLKNLDAAGIDVYGAQYRMDESSVKVRQVGNNTVLFIGLNDTNTPIDIEKFKQLILLGQSIEPDLEPEFTVVNVHWGEEYKEISNSHQRELAHKMIDAGADIVIGHHPHVVQEMEVYKNRPIFYSLGNFVFDQYFSVPTQQGLAVGIALRRNNITTYVFPLEQDDSRVRQMSYEKRQSYLKSWLMNSRLDGYLFDINKLVIETN